MSLLTMFQDFKTVYYKFSHLHFSLTTASPAILFMMNIVSLLLEWIVLEGGGAFFPT